MSKEARLFVVLDSEMKWSEFGQNSGHCGVFSTYADALASAKARHERDNGEHYDYHILIIQRVSSVFNLSSIAHALKAFRLTWTEGR